MRRNASGAPYKGYKDLQALDGKGFNSRFCELMQKSILSVLVFLICLAS